MILMSNDFTGKFHAKKLEQKQSCSQELIKKYKSLRENLLFQVALQIQRFVGQKSNVMTFSSSPTLKLYDRQNPSLSMER